MALVLSEIWPVHTKRAGSETFDVTAGQTLKVETSPSGEEVLEATCPEGKAWSVTVVVDITEIDA